MGEQIKHTMTFDDCEFELYGTAENMVCGWIVVRSVLKTGGTEVKLLEDGPEGEKPHIWVEKGWMQEE